MSGILEWGDPPRAEDPAKHREYHGGGVAGAYAPNMDREWMRKWKALLVGTRNGPLRIEIRKSVSGGAGFGLAQVKVVVYERDEDAGEVTVHDGKVTISMNGTADFSAQEFGELSTAVYEARHRLLAYRAEQSYPALPERVRTAVEGIEQP